MMYTNTSNIALVLMLVANLCSADTTACLGHDPVAAVKEFFAKHYDFYSTNPDDITGIISPRLHADLQTEYKCVQGAICAIEADPWTDAQDGETSEPITFTVKSVVATNAEVAINYLLKLAEDSDGNTAQNISIHLERSGVDACWVVADLISPSGESLVKVLEDWHAKKHAGSKP